MWEHLQVTTTPPYRMDQPTVRYLSYLGASGWEGVSAGDWGEYSAFYFFKRPYDPDNGPPGEPPESLKIVHFTPAKA